MKIGKIIVRTLIILLVAGVVCGAAYSVAQAVGENNTGPGAGFQPGGELENGPGQGGFRPDGDSGHDHFGGGFNLMTTLKNLGIVGAITLAVAGVSTAWTRIKRRTRAVPASPE